MTQLIAILIFIFGTAIGSFLSVLIFRVKNKKKGVLSGRSICPYCKKKLKPHHLIPILSWIFLRGKCGFCGKKISAHYLVLEIMTGLIFLTTFLHWNFIEIIPSTISTDFSNYYVDWNIFAKFLFYLIELTFLMEIFFYDLLYKEIPDRFSIPAIAVAIAGGLAFPHVTILEMLIGAVAIGGFFALMFFGSRGRWIGGGDIRLGVLMGALLGWKFGLMAFVTSYMVGAIVSITLLIQKKVKGKTEIPFAPFLITGILVALFFGPQILNWYNGFLF